MVKTLDISLIQSALLSVFIVVWLYWLWSRRFLYKFSWNYPGFWGLPILGSILTLRSLNNLIPLFFWCCDELKSRSFCVWIGTYPVLIIADPELLEQVLTNTELLNKAKIYKPFYEAFGGGLIASPHDEWRKNRKAINASFIHKVLVSFFPVFNKANNRAVLKLSALADDGKSYALSTMFQRLTLSISVETTMGKEMSETDEVDESVVRNIHLWVSKVSTEMFLYMVRLKNLMKLDFKYQRALNDLRKLVKVLILEKLDTKNSLAVSSSINKSSENITKNENIFVDQAINLYRSKVLSWNDVSSESMNIVLAAFETTAHTLYSTILMLAMHPDIQDRLFEDVCSVFPDKSFEMDYSHINALPYLDRIINEVLRLIPPISFIGRLVVKDTKINDTLVLPKDLQVLVFIYHLHRSKDIWGEDADKFDPDHFLPENLANKHPYAYIPFSKGPRNCIGWRYALMALKVLVTGLVRNFRFETDYKYSDLKFIASLTLKYAEEPKMRIYKRE